MAVAFVGAASSTNGTITLPSFTPGDVALAFFDTGATLADTLANGWKRGNTTTASTVVYVAYRVLQAGDSSFTWSGVTDVGVLVYSGVDPGVPIGNSNVVAGATSFSNTISFVAASPEYSGGLNVNAAICPGATNADGITASGWTNRTSSLAGTHFGAMDGGSAAVSPTFSGTAQSTRWEISLNAATAYPHVDASGVKTGTVASNSTSWTLTYPANIEANDLLLAFMALDGTGTSTTWPAGWVAVGAASGANALVCAKKKAVGTETGTFSVTTPSEQGAWKIYRIPASDWEGTLGTTFDNTANAGSVVRATATAVNANPNPPSLDPNNWGTEATLWWAVASSDTSRTYSAYPTNFIGTGYLASGGTGGATLAWGHYDGTAASVDPGTFTHSASDDWVAGTIAVRKNLAVYGSLTAGAIIRRTITKSAAPAPLPEIVGSATNTKAWNAGTGITINTPTGTQDGDLMVAFLTGDPQTSDRWWTNAGWTFHDKVQAPTIGYAYSAIMSKVASSEAATQTFEWNTSYQGSIAGGIVTFRNAAVLGYQSYSDNSAESTTHPTATLAVPPNSIVGAAYAAGKNVTLTWTQDTDLTELWDIYVQYSQHSLAWADAPAGGTLGPFVATASTVYAPISHIWYVSNGATDSGIGADAEIIAASIRTLTASAIVKKTIAPTTVSDSISQTASGLVYGIGKWTNPSELAQGVLFGTAGTLDSVSVKLAKAGSPTDDVVFELRSDASGYPGSVIGTIGTVAASGVAAADDVRTFSPSIAVEAGTTYWISARRTGAVDFDNNISWYLNDANPYADGRVAIYSSDSTLWSYSDAGYDFYFTTRVTHPAWSANAVLAEVTANVVTGSLTANAIIKKTIIASTPPSYEYDSMTTLGATYGVGATVQGERRAQAVVFGSAGILDTVSAWLLKTIGDPVDNLIVELCADSGGLPGAVVGTIATVVASTIGDGKYTWNPSIAVSAGTYWIVMRRSGSLNASNYILWYANTEDSYAAGGSASYWSSWQANSAGIDFAFETRVALPVAGGTIDAVIVAITANVVTGSLTANAVLFRTQTGSRTANAVVKRSQTGTGTANAIIRKSQTATFTANAVVKRERTGTLTGNAVRRREQTGTRTANAVVRRERTGTATADAIVRKTQSGSVTANAVKLRTMAGSLTASSVLFRTQAGSGTANAVIVETLAGSFSAGAVIKRERTGTLTGNAIVRRERTGSGTANAVLRRERTGSLTANAIVMRTASAALTANAAKRATIASSLTASAVVKRTATATFLTDAVLVRTTAATAAASAVVQRSFTTSLSANALFNVPRTGAFTANAIRRTTVATSITSNAITKATASRTLGVDAVIFRSQTAATTANAVLRLGRVGSFSASAIIRKSASGSFISSAILRASTTGSFSGGAVVRATTSGTFAANAVVRATSSSTLTTDAILRRTIAGASPVSAVLRRSIAGSLSAAAVITKAQSGSLAAAAILRVARTATFTAGAVALRTAAASLGASAIVRRGRTGSLSANAVSLATRANTFAASAIVIASRTSDYRLDAIVRKPRAGSTTADAIINRTGVGSVSAEAWILVPEKFGSATADAILLAPRTASFAATAWIGGTGFAAFASDAVIFRSQAGSTVAEAVLRKGRESSATASAIVLRGQSASASADAVVRSSSTGVLSVNAIVRRSASSALSASSVIRSESSHSLTAAAVVRHETASGLTVHAVVQRTSQPSLTTDAILLRGMAGSFTVGAVIYGEGGAKLFGADAVISRTQAASTSTDAVLRALRSATFTASAITRAAALGSIGAGAVIAKTASAQLTAQSVLRAPRTVGVTASAVTRSPRTGTLTAAALIAGPTGNSFTVGAVLLRDQSSSFSAGAVLRIARASSFSANAYLLSTNARTFTAAAIVAATRGSSVAAEAVLRGESTNSLTAAALLRRSSSITFTAGAIARRSASASFGASAELLFLSRSFTASAAIRGLSEFIFSASAVITVRRPKRILADLSAATITATITATTIAATILPSPTIAATLTAGTIAARVAASGMGSTLDVIHPSFTASAVIV